MSLEFKKECGVIVSANNKALRYVEGTPTSVEFPEEVLWELHKANPGSVYKLVHSHPDGMSEPSNRDLLTLKTWAFAMYPFPARLSIIYYNERTEMFNEKVFIAQLESRGDWLAHNKGIRMAKISLEFVTEVGGSSDKIIPWEEWILEHTYES